MKRFLAALDNQARAIWWHLCCHGHADVASLARVAGLDSDMEVLLSIRQVINPAAAVNLGDTVLEFASCRVDQGTGEKIHYHWWLKPGFGSRPAAGRPLVDVFETDNELVVIIDSVSRVELCRPEVTCRNGVVMIKFERSGNL